MNEDLLPACFPFRQDIDLSQEFQIPRGGLPLFPYTNFIQIRVRNASWQVLVSRNSFPPGKMKHPERKTLEKPGQGETKLCSSEIDHDFV